MLVEEDNEESRVEGSGSIEFARGGVAEIQEDRRMSLNAHLFLLTLLNLLMRMGSRHGSSGPYPILTIEKATSNGCECADYEQPFREGGIGGKYGLEMARERLRD